MENCSILSHTVNYVQYDGSPKDFYNLSNNVIDQKSQENI